MVFEEKYKVMIDDINKDGDATNKAILSYLEDIACSHSSSVGAGPLTVTSVGYAWVLLDWKVKILKRPKYNEQLNVKTWSRGVRGITAFRDFEIKDENDNTLVIATSRWVLIDIDTRRPTRITEEHMKRYECEPERKIFDEEFEKIKEENEFLYKKEYEVKRMDIDMNNHMHNLNYLDLAYEVLPDEVYENSKFNNIEIEYKKEIKYGEKVECYYISKDEKHIITVKTDDKTNAIIILEA